jgi:hypothetical protein
MTSIFVAIVLFGALAALGRLRGRPAVIRPIPEPIRHDVTSPPRFAQLDPRPASATPSIPSVQQPAASPRRDILTNSVDRDGSDRTAATMAAMQGPGICTQRDC